MDTSHSPSNHYGMILDSRKVAGLTVTENTYAPGVRLPKHTHEQACFCLVLQGLYTETYQQTTLTCEPLSLIFRPAGEAHSDRFSDVPVRCFIIEFATAWLDRVRKHAAKLDGPTTFQQNSLVWLAMRLRHEIKQQVDEVTPLVIEGLMLEMMADASRCRMKISGGTKAHWLEQATIIVRERLSERLTLSGIAAAVGVHPVYLATMFRRRYGSSVGEYLRQSRIEFACRELSTTDAPLSDVALSAGFSHQSHFARTFKRLTGLTPAQYRSIFRSP